MSREPVLYTASDITMYVPACNADATLDACLKGIAEQECRPARVLVIDDGSRVPVRRDDVEVITHPTNQGLSRARNTALGECHTPLIAAVDSDVVPDPLWLGTLLDVLNTHQTAGVGGCLTEHYQHTLADRWRTVHMAQHWGNAPLSSPRFLFGANTLFRADLLRHAGGYCPDLRTNNEDRTMSEILYANGRHLRYEPQARCSHLRRDTVETILPGYWKWHHAKGLVRGDFDSAAGICNRIREVNFGIFRYRFDLDRRERREDFLALDLAIPWVFCMLDLRMYAQRTGENVPPFLLQILARELPREYQQFFQRMLPPSTCEGSLLPWAPTYIETFLDCLQSMGYRTETRTGSLPAICE